MRRRYDKCEYCGGQVRARKVTVDLRTGDRLHVFYNVPVGVCAKCGERYYPGPILERLNELAEHDLTNGKRLTVPTFDFAAAR